MLSPAGPGRGAAGLLEKDFLMRRIAAENIVQTQGDVLETIVEGGT